MSNIKGLYFKLNIDNPRDEAIYRFFTMQPESEKIDKIALLDKMTHLYKETETVHRIFVRSRPGNLDEIKKIFKQGDKK